MSAIATRLRRLEDQFGTADGTPRRCFRIVVRHLDGKQENACRRTFWPDGTLSEVVHLGCAGLAGEELDRWITNCPIDAN